MRKFAHGIYPRKPHSLIYEKPDVNYAAAVHQSIKDQQETLTLRRQTLQEEDKDLSETETERLQKLGVLEIGLRAGPRNSRLKATRRPLNRWPAPSTPVTRRTHDDPEHAAERNAAINAEISELTARQRELESRQATAPVRPIASPAGSRYPSG